MDSLGHATFSNTSFAEGRSRRSYKGTYLAPSKKKGQQCVVKEYKSKYAWAKGDWDADMSMQKKATELAEKFNEETGTTRPIYYVDCDVWKVSSSNNGTPKLGEWCIVEDYLMGEWTKWNSNAGYVNPQVTTVSLHAFSHWTWVHTKGKMMVCDLQGVRRDDRYILTDPVICSIEGIYGETDLGEVGMAHFFDTHRCTTFCSRFPKPTDKFNDLLREQLGVRQHSHTSFSSEDNQLPMYKRNQIKRRLQKPLEGIPEE